MAKVTQTFIPVVRERTKTVLGVLNIGSFKEFLGNETSTPTISGQVVPIEAYYPDNTRILKNPFYMAYMVDDRNFREQEYSNFADFESVNSFNMITLFQSPPTMPNIITEVPNDLRLVIAGKRLDDVNVAPPAPATAPNPVTGLSYSKTNATNYDVDITDLTVGTAASVSATVGAVPAGMTMSVNATTNAVKLAGKPTGATGAFSFTATVVTDLGNLIVPVSGTILA